MKNSKIGFLLFSLVVAVFSIRNIVLAPPDFDGIFLNIKALMNVSIIFGLLSFPIIPCMGSGRVMELASRVASFASIITLGFGFSDLTKHYLLSGSVGGDEIFISTAALCYAVLSYLMLFYRIRIRK